MKIVAGKPALEKEKKEKKESADSRFLKAKRSVDENKKLREDYFENRQINLKEKKETADKIFKESLEKVKKSKNIKPDSIFDND